MKQTSVTFEITVEPLEVLEIVHTPKETRISIITRYVHCGRIESIKSIDLTPEQVQEVINALQSRP